MQVQLVTLGLRRLCRDRNAFGLNDKLVKSRSFEIFENKLKVSRYVELNNITCMDHRENFERVRELCS